MRSICPIYFICSSRVLTCACLWRRPRCDPGVNPCATSCSVAAPETEIEPGCTAVNLRRPWCNAAGMQTRCALDHIVHNILNRCGEVAVQKHSVAFSCAPASDRVRPSFRSDALQLQIGCAPASGLSYSYNIEPVATDTPDPNCTPITVLPFQ